MSYEQAISLERLPQDQIRSLGRALLREFEHQDFEIHRYEQSGPLYFSADITQSPEDANFSLYVDALRAYFRADPVTRFPFFSRMAWSPYVEDTEIALWGVAGFRQTPCTRVALATVAALVALPERRSLAEACIEHWSWGEDENNEEPFYREQLEKQQRARSTRPPRSAT